MELGVHGHSASSGPYTAHRSMTSEIDSIAGVQDTEFRYAVNSRRCVTIAAVRRALVTSRDGSRMCSQLNCEQDCELRGVNAKINMSG